VDPDALAASPPTTGIRLVRVGDAPHARAASDAGTLDGHAMVVRSTTSPEATTATWTAGPPSPTAMVEFLPGAADDVIAAGAADAVAAPARPATERGIALVAPDGWSAGEGTRRAPRAAWMFDAIARLRADPLLVPGAGAVVAGVALDTTLPAVHRDATGHVDAVAAEATDTATARLLILLRDVPSLSDRAAWIAAARRAAGAAPDWNESESDRLTDAELAAAQRLPAPERDPSPPLALARGTAPARRGIVVAAAHRHAGVACGRVTRTRSAPSSPAAQPDFACSACCGAPRSSRSSRRS
jgi:hypothetical protein